MNQEVVPDVVRYLNSAGLVVSIPVEDLEYALFPHSYSEPMTAYGVSKFLESKDAYLAEFCGVSLATFVRWKLWYPGSRCNGHNRKGSPCKGGTIDGHNIGPWNFVPGD